MSVRPGGPKRIENRHVILLLFPNQGPKIFNAILCERMIILAQKVRFVSYKSGSRRGPAEGDESLVGSWCEE